MGWPFINHKISQQIFGKFCFLNLRSLKHIIIVQKINISTIDNFFYLLFGFSDMGRFGRVRLKMFELIILKILLQSSIFLLHSVPKCYTSILYSVKNLEEMTFKPHSSKKTHFFIYNPNPSSAKFAIEAFKRFDWHYSETMTYIPGPWIQI